MKKKNQTKEERNAYRRKWYRNNKEKHARNQFNYWKKVLKEIESEKIEKGENTK